MNIHKQRITSKSALIVSGLIVAAGWMPMAHAQDLQFAQKMLGAPAEETDSMQYRSTIIDPSRQGKSLPTNTNTLRVIPISNPAEMTGQDHSCSICGVVESISMTLQDRQNLELQEEEAFEGISRNQGKGKNNLLLTSNATAMPINAGFVLARQVKKPSTIYAIKVRMNDGTFRVINETREPDYTVGDYVRVISGAVTAA
jgi:hypothetical protein